MAEAKRRENFERRVHRLFSIAEVDSASLGAFLIAPAFVYTGFAQSSSTYHVTHTYTLGGDGGWDYVVPDPPAHRVYIGRQNRVMVVDEDNGKLLGEVTGIVHDDGSRTGPGEALNSERELSDG